jgi:hypothetical protein
MMKRYNARSALAAAAAVTSLLVLISGSPAAAAISSEDDNHHLRRRPVGVSLIDHEEPQQDNSAPSGFFGSILRNLLNTSEDKQDEDLDSHYPLFLTTNERSEDDYDINDVLLSFTIRNPSSDIMRQPPARKLSETAAVDADTAHADEGELGDAHDMVVHVTYENIYAIIVFLMTATALGIFTSMLGMVSAIMVQTN